MVQPSAMPTVKTGRPTPGELSRVSALVVCYHGREQVGDCLSSLRDCEAIDEIIVVDNGSTDGTSELLARTFPEVRSVPLAGNLGYGGGNNVAATYAVGTYLLIVNQDLVVSADFAAALVQALEQDPSAVLAAPKILLRHASDRINACGTEVHLSGLTVPRGFGQLATDYAARAPVLAVSGAAFLIRRAAWDELGGFDEAFFMYHEDTDLSLRAALAGYAAVYVPEAVAWHDYTASFGTQKVFWLERNRYALLLKIFRWRTLLALAPALALAEIVTLGYAALTSPRHLWAKARAYAWLVRNVGSILRKRRTTQAIRTIEDRAILARCAKSIPFDQARSGSLVRYAEPVFDHLFRASYWFALKVVQW